MVNKKTKTPFAIIQRMIQTNSGCSGLLHKWCVSIFFSFLGHGFVITWFYKKSNNSTKVDTMIWIKYQMDESKYTSFIFTRLMCCEGTLSRFEIKFVVSCI